MSSVSSLLVKDPVWLVNNHPAKGVGLVNNDASDEYCYFNLINFKTNIITSNTYKLQLLYRILHINIIR